MLRLLDIKTILLLRPPLFLSQHLISWHVGLFLAFDFLSVLRGHSVVSPPPQRPMTSNFEGVYIPDFINYIYFPILILKKEPVFSLLNVQC